ncbi:MAG: DNA polymerase III subunit beta [Candidatus Shapirobacteria bacterium]|nr:DNA polymerase III subunit beta [Candidatus Shapirobacteria bacterium]
MKVYILQENLTKGLTAVNRFITTKTQLPILNNILIKTDQGRLKLSATNLETGINFWLGAKIEKEGEVCIPAKTLAEYITSLPADKIDLEVENNLLKIHSGSYQAQFLTSPSVEFPEIPTLEKKPEINLSFKDLSLAINQVAFAATQDEGRPVLTGVLLKVKKQSLFLVATDGYRLSVKEIKDLKEIEKIKETEELLIPARALIEVGKVMSSNNSENNLGLTITPKNNQIIFSNSEVEIISRLIEGKFPDFEKIIPEKGKTKIVIETESLLQAVRTTSIFAREAANIIKMEVSDSKIEISANNPQMGENKIKLEAKTEGEGGKIAFNSRYLIDFLNSTKSDLINLQINDALSPGVFSPVDDPSYLHVIMPIRLQE